jgi:hypothetical protein
MQCAGPTDYWLVDRFCHPFIYDACQWAERRLCDARSAGSGGVAGAPRQRKPGRYSKAGFEQRQRQYAARVAAQQAELAALTRVRAPRRTPQQRARLERLREQRAIRRAVERSQRKAQQRIARRNAPEVAETPDILERFRRKLAVRYPAAIETYNNPFTRLIPISREMVRFLNSLPPEDIDAIIRLKEGSDVHKYLVERGYNPPAMYTRNPLHYHEDPYSYGI